MNRLPDSIQQQIYEFDNTYHTKFHRVLVQVKYISSRNISVRQKTKQADEEFINHFLSRHYKKHQTNSPTQEYSFEDILKIYKDQYEWNQPQCLQLYQLYKMSLSSLVSSPQLLKFLYERHKEIFQMINENKDFFPLSR